MFWSTSYRFETHLKRAILMLREQVCKGHTQHCYTTQLWRQKGCLFARGGGDRDGVPWGRWLHPPCADTTAPLRLTLWNAGEHPSNSALHRPLIWDDTAGEHGGGGQAADGSDTHFLTYWHYHRQFPVSFDQSMKRPHWVKDINVSTARDSFETRFHQSGTGQYTGRFPLPKEVQSTCKKNIVLY